MRVYHRDIPYITRLEVKGAGARRALENGEACRAGEEEAPFIRGEVPVDFTHSARGNGEEGD